MEAGIELSDIIELSAWQKFQDNFAQLTDIAVVGVGLEGEEITKPSNFNKFCLDFIRKSEEGERRCLKSIEQIARKVTGSRRGALFTCHAGFIYYAIPIIVKDEHFMTIVGGQVLTQKPDLERLKAVASEIGVSSAKIIEAAKEIKILPEEKFQRAVELMENVAYMISHTSLGKIELNRKMLELSSLYNIASTVDIAADGEEGLSKVIRKIAQIIEAKKCALLLLDEEGENLVTKAVYGLDKKYVNEFSCKIGEGVSGEAVKRRETIVVADFEKELESKRYKKLVKDEKLSSITSVPLTVKDNIFGTLEIYTPIKPPFTKDEISILAAVASQAAIAIENIQLYLRAEELATTDGLTNLYNFRFFNEALEKEIRRAKRYRAALSLIMLDIDRFKDFNDIYGHLKGNEILKEVAKILKSSVREVDIVARYGGEEFMIILPETEPEGALIAVERIRAGIAQCKVKDKDYGKEVPAITVSVGISGYSADILSVDDFVKRVDKAMYMAKKKGRDNLQVY